MALAPKTDLAFSLTPLLAIVGPTGSGKSSLGVWMAQRLSGEIVNCDSIQVYRDLDVGSAKTPAAAREHIPHHLIDILDIGQELTAGMYAQLARQAIHEIRDRGNLPIVVGGTGLYLRALLDGLSPAPIKNEQVRARLQALLSRRPLALHRFLRRFDQAASARIHMNDRQKLMRAIEIAIEAGRPASLIQSVPRNRLEGFTVLKLGLDPDRQLLYHRLNERSAEMFASGLLEETRVALERGAPASAKPLLSLGYKQAVQCLSGEASLSDAIASCQTRTRQYAKRQLTWFKHQPDVLWLAGFGTQESVKTDALQAASMFVLSASATALSDSEQPT